MARSAIGLVCAAALTAPLVAGCGGSGKPRPDLAFVSTRDGDYAIFVMNADGSRQKRLTHDHGDPATPKGLFFQVEPGWSPNGRRFAFVSKRDGHQHVYVMSRNGAGARRLTDTSQDDADPSWSPDGRLIAFSREGALFVVPATGDRARRLVRGFGNAADPAWSPNGKLVAYDYREPGGPIREIWLARADGSARRRLTDLKAESVGPAWSPDGRRIAFASNVHGGHFEIYTIGVDGKHLRQETSASSDTVDPAWSPDGKEIAFSRDGAIWTVDLGGNERKLTDAKNNDSAPAWKPGGHS
jgi:Tol biopolymer transport system component